MVKSPNNEFSYPARSCRIHPGQVIGLPRCCWSEKPLFWDCHPPLKVDILNCMVGCHSSSLLTITIFFYPTRSCRIHPGQAIGRPRRCCLSEKPLFWDFHPSPDLKVDILNCMVSCHSNSLSTITNFPIQHVLVGSILGK